MLRDLPRLRGSLEHWLLLSGAAGLLTLQVLGMGVQRHWWARTQVLSFRTYSAAGLQPGMAVKISGFPVGRVQQIRLLNDAQVQVTLAIAASRLPMVGTNSRATLAQDGLLSTPYIAISPDLNDLGNRRPLASGDTLIYEAGPDISTLIKDLAASRVPLQQMITRAGALMEQRLPRSLDQLDRTLVSGEQLASVAEQELSENSRALQKQVGRTTGELEQTLSSLQATLAEIHRLASSTNTLLGSIRGSWLLQLLEPSGTTLSPAEAETAPPNPPAERCPDAQPCGD